MFIIILSAGFSPVRYIRRHFEKFSFIFIE